MTISFDKKAVQKAKEAYQKVSYDPSQRKLVEETASILENAIDIPAIALKGFMLRAAKQWQEAHNKPIADLAVKSPSERISAVRELIEYLRLSLTSILDDPSMEDRLKLAIQTALTEYLKKYAGRE